MPDQEQQISTESGSFGVIVRYLIAITSIVAAVVLVAGSWNDVGAATGELPMRIFLVGWAVSAAIILAGFAIVGPVRRTALPPAVLHVVAGFVVGLAIGTTDWTALRLAGWWQLWWTVPLLLAYVGLLITLRRSLRTRP